MNAYVVGFVPDETLGYPADTASVKRMSPQLSFQPSRVGDSSPES